MFRAVRFPSCVCSPAAAAAAPLLRLSHSSVLSTAARHSSTDTTNYNSLNQKPSNYQKVRVVTENRLSSWCKRLWALSSGDPKPLGVAAAGISISKIKSEAGIASGHSSSNNTSTATATGNADSKDAEELDDVERMIKELKEIFASDDSGRVPSVVVEAVWQVYDTLLPYEVQTDLAARLRPEHVNHFFSFVHLLTELDFSLADVEAAVGKLMAQVERIRGLEAEMGALRAAMTADASGPRAKTAATVDAYRRAHGEWNEAKSLVTKLSIRVRSAGAPIFYSWLRHSASLEGGVRRLMDFRKTVHFFDIECRKRIKTLEKSRRRLSLEGEAAGAATAAADGDAEAIENELLFWHSRQQDVQAIDAVLSTLFLDFFSKEYLVMEELTWFTTPPSLLEQIMAAETVQPFANGLADMKTRLQPTHHRHLFAFLHPAVVEEPLIAVQVALTRGIANSVNHILGQRTPLSLVENTTEAGRQFREHLAKYGPDTADQEEVDSAIFYSINSAQSALRGMDMGNALIKRVVKEIELNINTSRGSRGLTKITRFSTLSPIPGYCRWLSLQVERSRPIVPATATAAAGAGAVPLPNIFTLDDWGTGGDGNSSTSSSGGKGSVEERYYVPLKKAMTAFFEVHNAEEVFGRVEDSAWRKPRVVEEKKRVAMSLIDDLKNTNSSSTPTTSSGNPYAPYASSMELLYLLFQSGYPWWADHALTAVLEPLSLRSVAHYLCSVKKSPTNPRMLDPVGNFHISNGATIFRINFLGNCTPQGSRESGCMMVNYWYNTDNIGENMSLYKREKVVKLDDFMIKLLES